MPLPFVLLLGFALGMRHATDPDHVVAVSALVARTRSLRRAAQLGAAWGLGHSATVIFVGALMIALGATFPPRLGLALELAVGAVLVALGARNIQAWRRRARDRALEETAPAAAGASLARSVVVGVVHGLAGSAAVTLLVLASIREVAPALLYLAVFGVGTVVGMVLLTVAFAAPLVLSLRALEGLRRHIVGMTGLASVVVGLFVAYEVVVDGGLFSATPTWAPR